MKNASIKLYGLAAPLLVLPVMGFGFDQIVPYIKGTEFRTLLAELLSQVFAGFADAFLGAGVQRLFGA